MRRTGDGSPPVGSMGKYNICRHLWGRERLAENLERGDCAKTTTLYTISVV